MRELIRVLVLVKFCLVWIIRVFVFWMIRALSWVSPLCVILDCSAFSLACRDFPVTSLPIFGAWFALLGRHGWVCGLARWLRCGEAGQDFCRPWFCQLCCLGVLKVSV